MRQVSQRISLRNFYRWGPNGQFHSSPALFPITYRTIPPAEPLASQKHCHGWQGKELMTLVLKLVSTVRFESVGSDLVTLVTIFMNSSHRIKICDLALQRSKSSDGTSTNWILVPTTLRRFTPPDANDAEAEYMHYDPAQHDSDGKRRG